MGEGISHTDIKHRPLSSLTPNEYQDVLAILTLIGATVENRDQEHVTLNVPLGGRKNALRIPATETVGALIDWARLMNQPPVR